MANSLEISYRKLCERHKAIDFKRLGSITGLTCKTGWTDAKTLEILKTRSIPEVKFENAQYYLVNFWKFYITGTLDEETEIENILIGSILHAIRPDTVNGLDFLFSGYENKAGDQDPILTIRTTLTTSIDRVWNYADKIATRRENSFKERHTHLDANTMDEMGLVGVLEEEYKFENCMNYKAKDYDKFAAWIHKVLNKWEPNKAPDQEVIDLLKLTSALALICLRATVKSQCVLENTFSRKTLIVTIQNLMKIENSILYAPPCARFFQKITAVFDQNRYIFRYMINLIVDRFIVERHKKNNMNKEVASFLCFTCLSSTSLNGLLMVKYLLFINKHLGLDFEVLTDLYCGDVKRPSWTSLSIFFKDCFTEGHLQTSAYWCRLINPAYYCDLKTDRNESTANWFRAMIAAYTGSDDVWRATKANELSRRLYFAKTHPEKIVKELMDQKETEEGADRGSKISYTIALLPPPVIFNK